MTFEEPLDPSEFNALAPNTTFSETVLVAAEKAPLPTIVFWVAVVHKAPALFPKNRFLVPEVKSCPELAPNAALLIPLTELFPDDAPIKVLVFPSVEVKVNESVVPDPVNAEDPCGVPVDVSIVTVEPATEPEFPSMVVIPLRPPTVAIVIVLAPGVTVIPLPAVITAVPN
jgi:hypothetical protein